MGWRERDWARFDDDEKRTLLGAPSRVVGRNRTRNVVNGGVALAVAVSAVAVLLTGRVHLTDDLRGPSPAATVIPSDVVAIRWRPTDLQPTPHAGRICVTDARHGRICASYTVGERPADTLTRRLATLGLRVQSSG
jgi:hypothetical protein